MITYTTAPGTAAEGSDFTAVSSFLVIDAGLTMGSIAVEVTGDTDSKESETFFVNLTGAINATIGAGQGRGTIMNDDGPTGSITGIPMLSEWALILLLAGLVGLALKRT